MIFALRFNNLIMEILKCFALSSVVRELFLFISVRECTLSCLAEIKQTKKKQIVKAIT